MSDDVLYNKLMTGDQEAYQYLMNQYNKLLWMIVGGILNKTGSVEDIEECVSDVYVTLWKNPKAFDIQKGTLKTFLAVMAKNKALDRYRKLSKIKTESNEMIYSDYDLLNDIVNKETCNELFEAVQSLTEPDKEIIIRRYYFDEKPASIADITSLPVKEIENRLYQSKLRLRKKLKSREVMSYGKYGTLTGTDQ